MFSLNSCITELFFKYACGFYLMMAIKTLTANKK